MTQNHSVTNLHDYATPVDRCVVAPLGPISQRILDELGDAFDDEALVVGDSGQALVAIRTVAVRTLYEAKRSLEPTMHKRRLEPIVGFDRFWRAARVHLVDSPLRLVTISALSKHPMPSSVGAS